MFPIAYALIHLSLGYVLNLTLPIKEETMDVDISKELIASEKASRISFLHFSQFWQMRNKTSSRFSPLAPHYHRMQREEKLTIVITSPRPKTQGIKSFVLFK